MNSTNPFNSHDESQDLSRLKAGLKAIRSVSQPVPDEVDRVMRLAIAGHFEESSSGRERGRGHWRVVSWTAAAAGILAAVWMLTPAYAPKTMVALGEPSDIDRNGKVDVLDAFMLARRIESGFVIEVSADVNHDGKIDSRDVDAIAQRAVALQPVAEARASG